MAALVGGAAAVAVTAVVFAAYTICLLCPRVCIVGAVGWLLEETHSLRPDEAGPVLAIGLVMLRR